MQTTWGGGAASKIAGAQGSVSCLPPPESIARSYPCAHPNTLKRDPRELATHNNVPIIREGPPPSPLSSPPQLFFHWTWKRVGVLASEHFELSNSGKVCRALWAFPCSTIVAACAIVLSAFCTYSMTIELASRRALPLFFPLPHILSQNLSAMLQKVACKTNSEGELSDDFDNTSDETKAMQAFADGLESNVSYVVHGVDAGDQRPRCTNAAKRGIFQEAHRAHSLCGPHSFLSHAVVKGSLCLSRFRQPVLLLTYTFVPVLLEHSDKVSQLEHLTCLEHSGKVVQFALLVSKLHL
mmetsp:Transcript_10909/g.20865  ORF Transcript_10909/g.20865 Transcript_10909/m.20865 type:complete len:296 (+) Transcript_10909:163-1050(+)